MPGQRRAWSALRASSSLAFRGWRSKQDVLLAASKTCANMCRVECCEAESSPTAAQTGDKEKQEQRERVAERKRWREGRAKGLGAVTRVTVAVSSCVLGACCYCCGVYLSALLLPLDCSVCTRDDASKGSGVVISFISCRLFLSLAL